MTTVFHRILRCASELLRGIPHRLLLLRKFQRDRNSVTKNVSQSPSQKIQHVIFKSWKQKGDRGKPI